MWHHRLCITYERGAASWQAVQILNETAYGYTAVNVLDSFMYRQDWCTNLICNHQFVPRNYKVYCTSMSIRNQTWIHSIIIECGRATHAPQCSQGAVDYNRPRLVTLQSVRCTSAHAGTKRNNRTSRSSEQLFCFILGMSQVQTSARRMTIPVYFVVSLSLSMQMRRWHL